jgi:PKD repeat protein
MEMTETVDDRHNGVGIYRAIGYTAFGILLLFTLYFFFPPATALEPNGTVVWPCTPYTTEICKYSQYFSMGNVSGNIFTVGGQVTSVTKAQAVAFCTAIGHADAAPEGSYKVFSGQDGAGSSGGWGGGPVAVGGDIVANPGTNNYYAMQIHCEQWRYAEVFYPNGTQPTVTVAADFNATPTNGVGPLYVSFRDNSTGTGINAWNWSISPITGWWAGPYVMDDQDFTAYFTANGNYTITHGAANAYTSDIETKTDYIWIYNSSSTATTQIHLTDLYSGWPIQSASLNMKDIENNSWTNVTTGTNGAGEITTLMNHHINAYGSASGYDDNDLLNILADGSGYSFSLMPTGFSNVTAGNVTLYVTVVDDDTTFRLAGATVNIGSSVVIGGDFHSVTTNAAGVAKDVVKNNTIVHLYTSKSGYNGVSSTVNTGTGSGGSAHVDVEVRLTKSVVTPTATITTLPGGGYPTTAQTYLQYCNPDASDYDAQLCAGSQNSNSMQWLSANALLLIQVCFLFTLLYIMGWKP